MADLQGMVCRSHPDFHIPADVIVGARFDGDDLGRKLKDVGADSIAIFAKCHYGHAYYPTRLGTPHPGLQRDILSEAVEGCSRHGVSVTAYYSVFLDSAAAVKHPEWRVKSSDTGANAGFDSGNYTKVCVSSGYIEELLIPQSVEIVTSYDVAEIFYDTMTGFQPCFCDMCKSKYGGKIPHNENDPDWLRYVRWYYECHESFFAECTARVREANSKCGCIHNWKWGIRDPRTPPAGVTRLSSDCRSSGSISSRHARLFAGSGLPADFMVGRFLHGLGDWDTTTDESMLYTAAGAIANGAGFYIIDRMLPDGTLEPRSYEIMDTVFSFINERREWVENTEHVPEIAILSSYNSIVGKDLSRFALPKVREDRMKSVHGAVTMLQEHGRHFTVLSEEGLREGINAYGCVIVPDQEELDEETIDALIQYVENGGHLLISQATWHDDPSNYAYQLGGVQCEGVDDLHYGYIGTEPPFHVRGRFARVLPTKSTPVIPCIEPMHAGDGGKRFGHGMAPPDRESRFQAVTERTLGKGKVVYIAMPIFHSYAYYQSFYTSNLVLDILDQLLPRPLVSVDTGAQVECAALRKGNDLIVHLVNHSGRERVANWVFPVTEYLPEIRDIGISIRASSCTPQILSVPDRTEIAYEIDGGYAHFTAPPLTTMVSFVVKDYFVSKEA